MEMKKIVSIVAVLAIVLGGLFMLGGKVSTPSAGGNINPVNQDVYSLSIGGTSVISHARALVATALTVSGATSIGSITAGLNYYKPVVDLTADTTLTVAQTDTIFNMGTAGVDATLPAPAVAAGVHYRFVVSAAFATTDMTIVAGTADTIEGSLIVAGAVVACDAADLITIAAANEDVGDFIDLYSNGVKWMIGANQAMTASNHACSG
jgi:hypothetical protein